MSRRPGRRPGDSGTREAILAAARARFASSGYDRATIRAIAGDAGVDPALVHHYFGPKRELFRAAVRLPFRPQDVLPDLLEADPETVGVRLVEVFLATWDRTHDRSPILALLRSAVADESAAQLTRAFVEDVIIRPVAETLAADRPELRAALAASQIVGLVMARYVLRVEPLASAEADVVAAAIGPTLQRYLAGDLDT
jgi:AcrR family transcriptional regulator